MNYTLLENVQALLDYNKIPNDHEIRAAYLCEQCSLSNEDVTAFLLGEKNLPLGEVRKLANAFEVDLLWLVGKT